MSKQRIKKPVGLIASRTEAEAAMNELASLANNKRMLTAALDEAVLKLQDEAGPAITLVGLALDEKAEALRAWAESHPEEFPKDRKSIAFLSGTLGFRTGTPKLALLSRAWDWDKVLAGVQHLLPNFVRSKSEVDREAILALREDEAVQYALPRVGLKVVQGESFFVEPNLSDTKTS